MDNYAYPILTLVLARTGCTQRQFVKKHPLSIKYTRYVNSSKVWFLNCRVCNLYKAVIAIKPTLPHLEDQLSTDNPVRLIDAFIGNLDLALGFIYTAGNILPIN